MQRFVDGLVTQSSLGGRSPLYQLKLWGEKIRQLPFHRAERFNLTAVDIHIASSLWAILLLVNSKVVTTIRQVDVRGHIHQTYDFRHQVIISLFPNVP